MLETGDSSHQGDRTSTRRQCRRNTVSANKGENADAVNNTNAPIRIHPQMHTIDRSILSIQWTTPSLPRSLLYIIGTPNNPTVFNQNHTLIKQTRTCSKQASVDPPLRPMLMNYITRQSIPYIALSTLFRTWYQSALRCAYSYTSSARNTPAKRSPSAITDAISLACA